MPFRNYVLFRTEIFARLWPRKSNPRAISIVFPHLQIAGMKPVAVDNREQLSTVITSS